MEREAHLQGTLHLSQKPRLLGSPVKESSLKVSLMESLREAPPLESSFIHLSKSPVYEPPPPPHTRFPSDGKGPSWTEMSIFRDFLNIYSRIPSDGAPPKAPSKEPLQREMLHHQSPLHPAIKAPGSPNGSPMERGAHLQNLFYISFKVPSKGAPSRFPSQSSHRERDTPPSELLSTIFHSPW